MTTSVIYVKIKHDELNIQMSTVSTLNSNRKEMKPLQKEVAEK